MGINCFVTLSRCVRGGERGLASTQLALVVAVPTLLASALGATVMRAGDFSTAQLERTVHAAVRDASSGIQEQGPAYARSDGTRITLVAIDIGTTAGGWPVDLDPTAATEPTLVRFTSASTVVQRVPYTVDWITGDGDPTLEPGEIAELDIDVSMLTRGGEPFTLEIRPAHGLYVTEHVAPTAASHLDAIIPLP